LNFKRNRLNTMRTSSRPLALTLSALSLIAGLFVFSACGDGSSSNDSSNPAATYGWNAITTLQAIDSVVGTGASASAGKRVSVHYTGWLYDKNAAAFKGKKFDSSLNGGQPFTFALGASEVIAGWDQGVAGMKVGGKRTLIIPASLGYGASGAGGVIPPGAALVFDVELLAVQ
jgi:FKBP-type peptidyl-prolyl cis-trans isomerase FkpA